MKWLFHLDRRVGFIKYSEEFGQTVYVSQRTYKHYFYLHKGFGFSFGVLKRLRHIGIKILIILYEHDGVIDKLITDMDFLELNGLRWKDKLGDYQIILPLNLFNQLMLKEEVTVGGRGYLSPVLEREIKKPLSLL